MLSLIHIFVVAVYDEHSDNNDAFYEAIADADVIVNSYVYFGKKEIDALKKCKVISFQSTGYNEVDLEYAEEKGVAVVSILDYCTQETAENAFAMMLCLQRAIRIYDRSVQVDKEWNYLAAQHLQRIEGQTMGIVGLGRICLLYTSQLTTWKWTLELIASASRFATGRATS